MGASSLSLLFLKGILVGFLIAAPVGPIGILCIRRSLAGRYGLGLITGLGAGIADTVYGAIAGFSLVSIANFINQYDFYLRLFGGIFVGWIGISLFKAPFHENSVKTQPRETFIHAFTSAFFLTLSNPVTLLVFAAAFAIMSVSPLEGGSFIHGLFLVGGVFVGANGWWFSLSTVVRLIHHKLSDAQLCWINRLSGMVLIGFSLYMLISLV